MNRKFTKRSKGVGRSLTFSTNFLQSIGLDVENVNVTFSDGEIRIKAIYSDEVEFPLGIAGETFNSWSDVEAFAKKKATVQDVKPAPFDDSGKND